MPEIALTARFAFTFFAGFLTAVLSAAGLRRDFGFGFVGNSDMG